MNTIAKQATEAGALDALSSETHPSRDAQHFRRIVAARKALEQDADELREAVAAARNAGDSWAIIGAALGVSRQSAHERFGKHTG